MPDIVCAIPRTWEPDSPGHGAGVARSARGTARKVGETALYRIAGKSGTAQVVAIKQGEKYDRNKVAERHRDHALFIAFAPADKPQIAVAVMVENGESGLGCGRAGGQSGAGCLAARRARASSKAEYAAALPGAAEQAMP